VIFLWILFRSVSLDRIAALVGRANPVILIAATLLFLADLVIRGARFSLMLEQATGARLGIRAVTPAYVASLGISDILPFRAGDPFRLFWFQRRFNLALGALMSAMLLERVLDLASVLLIGAVAAALSSEAASSTAREILATIFLLSAAVATALVVAPGVLRRALSRWFGRSGTTKAMIEGLLSMETAVRQMSRPARLVPVAFLSILIWVIEAAVMVSVWKSLGGSWALWLRPLLAFTLAALGTAVPSLPGHFGSFELAGYYAFHLTGVEPALAAGTLLATHLILWAPTAIFAVFWLLLRTSPGNSGDKIEKREGPAL
jgi:uncharacterized protein (TIRG00374 family)